MSRSSHNPPPFRHASRTEALAKSLHERRRAFERQALGLPGMGRLVDALMQPSLGLGLLVATIFASLSLVLVVWTRQSSMLAHERIADETRLVRVEQLTTIDDVQTRQSREMARQSTPRVYTANDGVIDAAIASIDGLPATVAGATTLLDIDPDIREQFGLGADTLSVLQRTTNDELGLDAWQRATQSLATMLRSRPLVDKQTYQRSLQEGTHSMVRLVAGGGSAARGEVMRSDLVNLDDAALKSKAFHALVRDAGFDPALRDVIVARLLGITQPTYTFDAAATLQAQTDAASNVQPVRVRIPKGEVIVRRGEVVSPAQGELYRQEMRAYHDERSWLAKALDFSALAAACIAITAAMAGYSLLFAQRIKRRTSRLLGLAILLLAAVAIACVGSVLAPQFAAPLCVLPTVLVAMLICIGYDRRTALAFGLLHGLLVCVALERDIATLAIIVTGVGCVVSSLREVRDRKSLVRTSVLAGLGVFLATMVFGILSRPVDVATLGVLRELAIDAGLTGFGMLFVGGLTLFLLPAIEKAFNVTTGMTLSELRDPKQPLLRELQLRAPGTYTHSLNVATIAEAAADAIGADSLLTYVGCLYHDVGKMNKPEYFVENQTAGFNRHDRLSPAMSLLIVVGHVKDGMELAREFKLPLKLQHFVEAHHGTTLVEYFYHRAKQRALGEASRAGDDEPDADLPDEYAYRYPGPKPRTKEVAILMIADACESATRAMHEPSPAKIEQLVRDIADKRLRDGQFDDCELTLKELRAIVDSVSRTLISMYHGRIAYPTGRLEEDSVQSEPPATEPKPLPGPARSA